MLCCTCILCFVSEAPCMNTHAPAHLHSHHGKNQCWVGIRNCIKALSGIRAVPKAHNCGSQKNQTMQFSNHGFQFFEISQIIAPEACFFDETRWFFEGFEIIKTNSYFIMIFSNTQNQCSSNFILFFKNWFLRLLKKLNTCRTCSKIPD